MNESLSSDDGSIAPGPRAMCGYGLGGGPALPGSTCRKLALRISKWYSPLNDYTQTLLALQRLQVPQYQLLGSKTPSSDVPGRVVLEKINPCHGNSNDGMRQSDRAPQTLAAAISIYSGEVHIAGQRDLAVFGSASQRA